MAKSLNNVLTAGLSGRIGKQLVFSQRDGCTIVSKFPNRKNPQTATQIVQRKKFVAAAAYAQQALKDPSLKQAYTEEAKKRSILSPYNMAMADYLRAPVVGALNTTAYTGTAAGQKIEVEVTNSFKVVSLKVKITSASNSLLEEGAATLDKGKWVYTTTALNATLSGSKITVTATDRPGNSTVKEFPL